MNKPTNEQIMVKALSEIARVSGMCIHQNTGRWDMRIEHDKRSYDILYRVQCEASEALNAIS